MFNYLKNATGYPHINALRRFFRVKMLQRIAVATLFLLYLEAPVPSLSSAQVFDETQVKAVFLYNLTKFVTWPQDGWESRTRFTIAILGNDPIERPLMKVVADETVKGLRIVVQQFDNPETIPWSAVDVLFITEKYSSELEVLVGKAAEHQILTVGDVEDFCRNGGSVSLLTEDRRVKIEVNLAEVKRAGLSISAHVLKLARITSGSAEEWK